VEPRTISKRLEKAIGNIQEAIAEGNVDKHLEAIKELELIVEEDPGRGYNPQILLFIGTYYGYLSKYDKAVETFEEVAERYPDSQFASLAQCAIGIIYNEKLGKKVNARRIFESIILKYPDSLEEMEAKKVLQ
jgi:TolA-binding protein